MPTNEDVNAEMPTDGNINADLDIDADVIKSHPLYQELDKKYSAARSGMDKTNLTRKQLEAENARLRVLAGEDEAKVEEEEPISTQYVTKDDLWLAQNANDIAIYGDEQYEKELALGIPKETALHYAKLRFKTDPSEAQLQRQKSNASGTASVRNLSNIEITDRDRENMKTWGYSEATLLKHKKRKGQL